MLRQFGQELVEGPPPQSFLTLVIIYTSMGLFAGIIFGTVDQFLNYRLNKFRSFGKIILLSSLVYLVTFFFLTVFGIAVFSSFDSSQFNWSLVSGFMFSKEMLLLLFYLYAVSFCIHFVKQINRKFGKKNLWRMLTGKFHNPREVNRIVMFLDLKASTTIAERIGHLAYSNLIQDCFEDLSIIKDYRAEVYQYVGDEVVLIWDKEKGLENANYIEAFFAFKNKIQARAGHYQSTYDVVPTFKGGCNFGQVVMAEVGQLKREIAYHGDTMNTASRIQSECNRYNKELLISESLFTLTDPKASYQIQYIDSLLLKGKTRNVKIYSVEDT